MDELCSAGISPQTFHQRHEIGQRIRKGRPLLQSLHGLFGTLLPDAERLYPGLLDLLQGADLADVRVRRISRAELPRADGVPGTLGVAAGAWVAPGAGGKDGRVHGVHVRDGDAEDELVLWRGHPCSLVAAC